MIFLATDEVSLVPPDGLDDHGWRLPDVDPVWSGIGNLQAQPGISDARASGDAGGRGPYEPAHDRYGQLYLPPEAPLTDGMIALTRGRTYVLSQVRLVRDPSGVFGDCQVATATGVDNWAIDDPTAQPVA